MQIYRSLHPDHAKTLDTEGLRRNFLVQGLFQPGTLQMAYSHEDRMILMGVVPVAPLTLPKDTKPLTGTEFLLQRRELGLINIGGPGRVTADGEAYEIGTEEALYLGAGTREVTFESLTDTPAQFYGNSAPAHRSLPAKKITQDMASPISLGAQETNNQRTIYRFLHPNVLETCQLLMGLTRLAQGSNWNTMPPHTHDRRCETYLYFDMEPATVVFHFMGAPQETRHLVMKNGEAAISPPWSIHAGCGTGRYTFIWCMAGENQVFEDMDMIAPGSLL